MTSNRFMMESDQEVHVSFNLSPGDIYQPLHYTWRNLLRWLLALFGCFFIYDARNIWFSSVHSPALSSLLALLLMGAFAGIVVFLFPYLRLRWWFHNYPVLQKQRGYTFNSQGIRLESEDARAEYKWSVFTKIAESPKLFYFLQTHRSGIYMPKRFPSNTEDIALLRKLIRENFKGEQQLQTTNPRVDANLPGRPLGASFSASSTYR